MTFSPDSEKLAKKLIRSEYENACKQAGQEFNDEYTDKYHSLYEGYAVLLEEMEELEEENEQLRQQIEKMKCCFNCDKPIKHLDCGDCNNGSNWELASERLIRSW